MDLQIQELRNSIMEEVILKNYKLLQFVEKEMNQLKDEIKLLKEENTQLREKTNKNLFCCDIQICRNIQNIQDTVENTMIIGYDKLYKPISFNVEKAFLIPSFNKCTELSRVLPNIASLIFLSIDVFKHFNKFNNFKTFNIDHRYINYLVDEKFDIMSFSMRYHDNINFHNQLIGTEYNDNGIIYIKLIFGRSINPEWYHKENLKKLLNILDECNIKLIINNIECDKILPHDQTINIPKKTLKDIILS
jgi:hypothetical protein